jgi:ATP phosphoribosyltransferase regulatory subunit
VLAALDLNEPWRRRLARAFGDPARLKRLIASAGDAGEAPGDAAAALAGADAATVAAAVAELFAATGLGVIGGRTAQEIADRFVEKTVLAQGIGDRAAKVLSEFLAIAGTPAKTIDELGALARRARLDIGRAVDRFCKRADAFAKRGVDVDRLVFAADFGRRLDYYTGFVFEFQRGKRARVGPIIGGGRYDRLMSVIPRPSCGGTGEVVPAVGFAIWLDRIGGRR